MISRTMAVAATRSATPSHAQHARDARVARSAALVLDLFVFGFITAIVNAVYGVTEVTSGSISSNGAFESTTTAVAWPWLTVLALLYFAIPEGLFGATPGKYWMHLKVVRLDGGPLGVGSVIIRNILKPIDFLPVLYLLGGLVVLATPGSQRIGDLAAGTTVVYEHRARDAGATRHADRRTKRILVAALGAAVLFTAGYGYFGRPPIVIDGLIKTGAPALGELNSYELGSPRWGFGTVTYPIRGRGDNGICSGSITLDWAPFGWHQSTTSIGCRP